MNICNTCRFYYPPGPGEHPWAGVCHVLGLSEKRTELGQTLGGDAGIKVGGSNAVALFAEKEGPLGLLVGPDFGCIHHQPKP